MARPRRKPAPAVKGDARLGLRGERVRHARETIPVPGRVALGMTQGEVEHATGLSPGALHRIEAGKSGAMDYTVAALAMVLAKSADYFLGLTDDPKPHGRK